MAAKGFSLKIDQKKLLRLIKKKDEDFLKAVRKEYALTSEEFLGVMIRLYYTTRNPDDTGLYSHTGALRQAWFQRTTMEMGDVISQISNTSSYGKVHEYGRPVGNKLEPGATKKARSTPDQRAYLEENPPKHIPQRTFVRRDFTEHWLRGYVESTQKAMKEFK